MILLLAYPVSFAQDIVSGMQSFYFSESQDAIVLQTCHQKIVFWTHKFVVGLVDMGTVSPRTHKPKIVNESLEQLLDTTFWLKPWLGSNFLAFGY